MCTACAPRIFLRGIPQRNELILLAIPAGFEPATLCLEGRCSIQLSYGIPYDALEAPYSIIAAKSLANHARARWIGRVPAAGKPPPTYLNAAVP